MPFVSGNFQAEQVNAILWRPLRPVVYQGKRERFVIPTDFLTDLASVPRIFSWLFGSFGLYTLGAILHDYLLNRRPDISRRDADGLFRRACRELGVPFARRWMMWAAVRLGSGLSGATPRETVVWLIVAIPSVALLILPTATIIPSLILLWFVEMLFFILLKPFSRKRVNLPNIWPPNQRG